MRGCAQVWFFSRDGTCTLPGSRLLYHVPDLKTTQELGHFGTLWHYGWLSMDFKTGFSECTGLRCSLPSAQCGALIGRGGENINEAPNRVMLKHGNGHTSASGG